MKAVIRNGSVFSPVLVFAAMLAIFAAPAEARNNVRDEVRLFQTFLQNRPRIAAELRANPRLVYDRRYLERRGDLARFLRRYPAVRREIVNNPHRVLGPPYRVSHPRSGWGPYR